MMKIRYFLCRCFGWHKPEEKVAFDGCTWHSKCKYCGKEIMEDSQGNWF